MGDARSLEKAFGRSAKASNSFGSSMAKVAKASAIAGGVIGAGLVVGLKKSVDAAKEAEVSQQKMQTQLKALGISYDQHAAKIETAIQKTSKLAALDDEELQDSFTALTRVTKDVNKALELNALAADIARGKGISLEAATMIVTKAQLGMVGSLKRQGIEIAAVTTAQDALKASSDKVTAAQMKSAKEADLAATKQKATAALQKTFAGAAEDYGKTSAAASQRFQVALENLKEHIGAKLLPALTKVTSWVADHLPALEKWSDQLGVKIQPKLEALSAWAQAHKQEFKQLFEDAKGAAEKAAGAISKLLGWTDRFASAIGGWDKLITLAITAAAIGKILALGKALQAAAVAAGALQAKMLFLSKMKRVGIVIGISIILIEGKAIMDFLTNKLAKGAVNIGVDKLGTTEGPATDEYERRLKDAQAKRNQAPAVPGESRRMQGVTRELQGLIRGPLQKTFREVFGFAMTAGIRDAIRSAKSNLSGLTGGLSGMVGQALDARRAGSLAALGNSPDAVRLRQIRAQQEAEADAREETRIRAEGDAQQLADFLLEREARTLQAKLALQEASINEEADKRKAGFDRALSDLTTAFNNGQISAAKFNTDLQGLLAATGVDWNGVGASLGAEFADGFAGQLAAIKAQIDAIAAVAGSGRVKDGPGVEKPMDAVKAAVAADFKKKIEKFAKQGQKSRFAWRVPQMATGGIVTRPTVAMIGEAGPEAIIPLTGPRAGGGMGTTIVVNVAGSVTSERELVDAIHTGLLQKKRRTGTLGFA